jgi:hypothetical protein
MLQHGGIYRTPGGQLVQVWRELISSRWHLDDLATGQPAYLERCGDAAPVGSLDRLDYNADTDGYTASPCDLCLDDLVLVQEAGLEWDW